MSILYNTSSSLVPKFQRHNLLRQQRDASPASQDDATSGSTAVGDDVPFESRQEKNSDGYLRELCGSVYPGSLHGRIAKLDPLVDLPLQAFMSLVWQNFISSWYGVKVTTCDDRFMVQLFDVVQSIAARLKLTHLEYESFLADDLPTILSEHVHAMRASIDEDDVYGRYCQLTSYKHGYYPQLLTNCILTSAPGSSTLQLTFLQALFNELLLGRIMDRICEPYFALSAIRKLCRQLEAKRQLKDEQPKIGSVQKLKNWITAAGRTIALMTSMKPPAETLSIPFPYINAFTFIFVDLLKLPNRKPFLYAIGKTLQYWSAKSKSINAILQNLFINLVKRRVSRDTGIRQLFVSLRVALFPEDNKMGMGTIVPEGDAFETFKSACLDEFWQTIRSFRLDSSLGVNENDVKRAIDIICREKRCNKLLFFNIIDCLLAHTNHLPV